MKLTKKGLQKGCLAVLGAYLLFCVLFLLIARDQIDFGGMTQKTFAEGEVQGAGTAGDQIFSVPAGADYLDQIQLTFVKTGRQKQEEQDVRVTVTDLQENRVLLEKKESLDKGDDGKTYTLHIRERLDGQGGEYLVHVEPERAEQEEAYHVINTGYRSYSSLRFVYLPVLAAVLALMVLYMFRMVRCLESGKKCLGTYFVMTLCRYKFLIERLVSRDFKTKYKRSVLGVFWSFLNPLLMMIVQYAVFSKLMRFTVENYIAYLLIGIVLFNGFSDCTNQSMRAIVGNAGLITKVYVPKYIYPVTKVLSAGINILLSMIPLLLVSVCTGLAPSAAWLMLPFGLVTMMLFIIGMGFILSSLMVFFRDIEFLWGVLTTAWMYATPIIYPISILPDFMQKLMIFNPLYHYINFFRTVVIDMQSPEPKAYAVCLGIAVAVCLAGIAVFRKTQDKFVLYI